MHVLFGCEGRASGRLADFLAIKLGALVGLLIGSHRMTDIQMVSGACDPLSGAVTSYACLHACSHILFTAGVLDT